MKKINRSDKRLSTLDLQILTTLAYRAQFKFPLLAKELFFRLASSFAVFELLDDNLMDEDEDEDEDADEDVADGTFLKKSSTFSQLQEGLKKLVKMDLVAVEGDHCTINQWAMEINDPPERSLLEWIESRKKGKQAAANLRAECKSLVELAIACNAIKAIGITGSVAAGSAKKNDDIDFIVVTKTGTMWLVRLMVLLASIWWGKKKMAFWGVAAAKDRWCFNLWLEEDALELPAFKRTAFDAFEALQISWLYDEANIEQRFNQENFFWMKKNLAKVNSIERIYKKSETNMFVKLINRLLFKVSSKHLHRKNQIPGKNLQLSQAFLHDGVSHLQYTQRWQELFWLSLVAAEKFFAQGNSVEGTEE